MKRLVLIILVILVIVIGFYYGYRQANGSGTHAPLIVSTVPKVGETEVDPVLDKITVTFNQDMAGGYAFTTLSGGGKYFPQKTGNPYWVDKRTCILPVKLENGRLYRVGINDDKFKGFKSLTGIPVLPKSIYFTTKGASEDLIEKLKPPVVVDFNPPNGAIDVDPNLTAISVTFNRQMNGDMSWVGGKHNFPRIIGQVTWDDQKRTCTMPVKLRSNQVYKLAINSIQFKNFCSEEGIPVEPTPYEFKTR